MSDIDPIAAMDQALRAYLDVARIVHAYYSALVAEGFTPEEALTLVGQYQPILFGQAAE